MAELELPMPTVEGLREVCEGFPSNASLSHQEALNYGICYGWLLSEMTWRSSACMATRNDPQAGKFAANAARRMSGHSFKAQAQAFINWANKNPEKWRSLFNLAEDPTIWAKFACKRAFD